MLGKGSLLPGLTTRRPMAVTGADRSPQRRGQVLTPDVNAMSAFLGNARRSTAYAVRSSQWLRPARS